MNQNNTVMKHFALFLASLLFTMVTVKAQEKFTISGKVVDKEGYALEGARVYPFPLFHLNEIADSTAIAFPEAVLTDKDGQFCIKSELTLIRLGISMQGMVNYEIEAKNDSVYHIVMQEIDLNTLKGKTAGRPVEGPITIRKPVIYLYPTQETEVDLQVNFDGKFTFTYPAYNRGWSVTAKPNGNLINKADKTEHNYLFWEGERYPNIDINNLKEGYVVEGKDVTEFLQSILPQLGLLPKEYNDFIVYWVPMMIENKWNLIHFAIGEEYDSISTNSVDPEPDTHIRVFMYFKALDNKKEIAPQNIIAPKREGFTLVEWGGAEL